MANALEFAGTLVKNKVFDVAAMEFAAAEKAGLPRSTAPPSARADSAQRNW